MPSDEQLREQFEEWVIQDMARFAAPDSSPAELRANVERRFERDKKTGLYIDECIRDRYRGYRARDAEVHALREALESIHYRATRWEVLPTVEAHQSVLQDIGEDALAALAGESGDSE